MKKIRTRAIYKAATGKKRRKWFMNIELIPSEQEREVLSRAGFHFYQRVER